MIFGFSAPKETLATKPCHKQTDARSKHPHTSLFTHHKNYRLTNIAGHSLRYLTGVLATPYSLGRLPTRTGT